MDPIIPEDGKVIIRIWIGRCIVTRYVQLDTCEFVAEAAANWTALEADACRAVAAQVGAITESGDVDCPAELAARAVWAE